MAIGLLYQFEPKGTRTFAKLFSFCTTWFYIFTVYCFCTNILGEMRSRARRVFVPNPRKPCVERVHRSQTMLFSVAPHCLDVFGFVEYPIQHPVIITTAFANICICESQSVGRL